AAKALNCEIYYEVDDKYEANDIILLNTSKNWGGADFFNYYKKNGYIEYQKLEGFIKKHGLTLKVALNICKGNSKTSYEEFKKGKFIFDSEYVEKNINL